MRCCASCLASCFLCHGSQKLLGSRRVLISLAHQYIAGGIELMAAP